MMQAKQTWQLTGEEVANALARHMGWSSERGKALPFLVSAPAGKMLTKRLKWSRNDVIAWIGTDLQEPEKTKAVEYMRWMGDHICSHPLATQYDLAVQRPPGESAADGVLSNHQSDEFAEATASSTVNASARSRSVPALLDVVRVFLQFNHLSVEEGFYHLSVEEGFSYLDSSDARAESRYARARA